MLKSLVKGLVHGFGEMLALIIVGAPIGFWYTKKVTKEFGLNED